mgnify:CR=1 FL=1
MSFDERLQQQIAHADANAPATRARFDAAAIDPAIIHPDANVARDMDCSFTNKGGALKEKFPLPAGVSARPIEDITPTPAALGDVLRRTRTLYSWDHYSSVLREAHISGCDIRVVSEDGVWHDPRHCDCALNIDWRDDAISRYRELFGDRRFVGRFIRELRTRWPDAGRRTWAGWFGNLRGT